MIDLKTVLSAVARTFGISSPEDLRKQKHVASKPIVPRKDPNNQSSQVDSDKSSDRPTESAQKR